MMGGDRQAFIGAYITPEAKDALRGYLNRIDYSMSQWLSDLIERELRTLGVPILEPYKWPELPFDLCGEPIGLGNQAITCNRTEGHEGDHTNGQLSWGI